MGWVRCGFMGVGVQKGSSLHHRRRYHPIRPAAATAAAPSHLHQREGVWLQTETRSIRFGRWFKKRTRTGTGSPRGEGSGCYTHRKRLLPRRRGRRCSFWGCEGCRAGTLRIDGEAGSTRTHHTRSSKVPLTFIYNQKALPGLWALGLPMGWSVPVATITNQPRCAGNVPVQREVLFFLADRGGDAEG